MIRKSKTIQFVEWVLEMLVARCLQFGVGYGALGGTALRQLPVGNNNQEVFHIPDANGSRIHTWCTNRH